MKAKDSYKKLGDDFIKDGYSDDWNVETESVNDLLTVEFNERYMGLMFDGGAEEIEKVYTAVFPSEQVMEKILNDNISNALLMVHHAAIWDLEDEKVFKTIRRDLLEKFGERNISIYCMHVPLDDFGRYSTSFNLADKMGLSDLEKFAPYNGAMAGVIGKTKYEELDQLKDKLEEIVGHQVVEYLYGSDDIDDGLVGVAAGGGLDLEVLKELKEKGVNTFVTGVTVENDFSKDVHQFAKENRINILGATHYSTEKFAMKSLVEYFDENLESEFVEEKPCLLDL